MTLSNLWQTCLLQLEDQVSASDLSRRVRPLQADVVSNNHIVLYASNMFVKGWVETQYLAQIQQICQTLAQNHELRISFKEGFKPALKIVETTPNTSLILESAVDYQTESSTPVKFASQRNTKHLFDNFVEGISNQLVCAVGQKLAQALGEPSADAFFLYGVTYLAKTQ